MYYIDVIYCTNRFQYCRLSVCTASTVLYYDVALHQPVHPAVLWSACGVRGEHYCLQDGEPRDRGRHRDGAQGHLGLRRDLPVHPDRNFSELQF